MEFKKAVAIVGLLAFAAFSYWYGEHREAKLQQRQLKIMQQQVF